MNSNTLHGIYDTEVKKWLDGDLKSPFSPSSEIEDLYYVCKKRKKKGIDFIVCPNFKTPKELQGKGLLTKFLNICERYCKDNNTGLIIEDFSNDAFFIHLIEKRKWIPITGNPIGDVSILNPLLFEEYKELVQKKDTKSNDMFLYKLQNPKALYLPTRDLIDKFFLPTPISEENNKGLSLSNIIIIGTVFSSLIAYGILSITGSKKSKKLKKSKKSKKKRN